MVGNACEVHRGGACGRKGEAFASLTREVPPQIHSLQSSSHMPAHVIVA